jgi:hypothetical protein
MNDVSLFLLLLVLLYFLPTLLAWRRGVRAINTLFVFNLLIGWSGIGWLLVLWQAMALSVRTNDDY